MFITFLIGLFLLSIVFGIKLVEMKRGSKIVLVEAREQADEWLFVAWERVCEQSERGLIWLREIWLTTHWRVRKHVAESLRRFARHLHN